MEEGFRKQQACQPVLSIREDCGADGLERNQEMCAGDQAYPAWIHKRQVLLVQLDLLLLPSDLPCG